jgi:hypothetical protein
MIPSADSHFVPKNVLPLLRTSVPKVNEVAHTKSEKSKFLNDLLDYTMSDKDFWGLGEASEVDDDDEWSLDESLKPSWEKKQ